MRIGDWSSDVCSSDLLVIARLADKHLDQGRADTVFMTIDQVGIIVLLGVMFIAYALDRFRIELVALTGLATAFAIGLVPSTALFGGFRSEEHTSELQSLLRISSAVFCLKKKKQSNTS